MIHIVGNTCPICLVDDLKWNLNIYKSDMQMFKCGHGTCKSCYKELRNKCREFSCPCCRGSEQELRVRICSQETEKMATFAEWYNIYEIYITSGVAANIIKHSTFGKQLIRLCKERRRSQKN